MEVRGRLTAGEKLTALRTERGLSQQELADRLYVSRSLVAMWETGARTPDRLNVEKLAGLFEVEAAELIADTEHAYSSIAELNAIDAEIAEFTSQNGKKIAAAEPAKLLNEFLDRQKKRDKALFMSRYFEMKTHKALSEEYGIGEVAVRVKLSRMRRRLRQFIAREESHDK